MRSSRWHVVVAAALLVAGVAPHAVAAPEATAIAGCATPDHPGGAWRWYSQDQAGTRSQPDETTIGPEEAASLTAAGSSTWPRPGSPACCRARRWSLTGACTS